MKENIMAWLLITAAVVAVLLFPFSADARRVDNFRCEADGIPNEFDPFFSVAARRHMPHTLKTQGACLLKAQCFVESRLKEDAVSPAQAIGACQILRGTAGDLERRGKWRGKLRVAKDNIEAASIIFTNYWNFWSTPRSTECHLELTWASYNAGPGSILKAQKNVGGALCWSDIQFGLPEVTGRHAKETIQYTHRIWQAWRRLRGYGL